MKIYDESLYCQECGCEISTAQSKFCNDYCDDCYELAERQEEIVPTEEERLSLLEPAPFESGVCKGCGEGIAAGMQHAHKCLKDQRVEPRWQWEERRYELERLAYCGYED